MADLQSIMQALRNADAAGNTADTQRVHSEGDLRAASVSARALRYLAVE